MMYDDGAATEKPMGIGLVDSNQDWSVNASEASQNTLVEYVGDSSDFDGATMMILTTAALN